jgi:hypothetical protein
VAFSACLSSTSSLLSNTEIMPVRYLKGQKVVKQKSMVRSLLLSIYPLGGCYNNVPISLYTILTTLYLMSKYFVTVILIYGYDQEVEQV